MAYSNSNKKAADPMVGKAYIKKNDSGNEKAPFMKGFVSISPELAAALQNITPDKFGNLKLEVAVWKSEQQGVLMGTAQLPYSERANTKPAKSVAAAVVDGDDF